MSEAQTQETTPTRIYNKTITKLEQLQKNNAIFKSAKFADIIELAIDNLQKKGLEA